MNSYGQMKLGRAAIQSSPERMLLGHRIFEALPAAPPAHDSTNGVTFWGVMNNDKFGNCTIAGLGHSIQVATLGTGKEVTPNDDVIDKGYQDFCGYVPGDPATDCGGVEVDVLSMAKREGFGGMKLLDHVSIDPRNLDHVRKGIAYFGSVYTGAALPLSSKKSGTWDVALGRDGVPGSWGGHCMVSAKYDRKKAPFITWGVDQDATWDWWLKYVDECHVLLWDCWMKRFPASQLKTVMTMLHSLEG